MSAFVIFPCTILSRRWRAVMEEVDEGCSKLCITVGNATRTASILIHSRLKALAVNLSRPSSRLWLYAGLRWFCYNAVSRWSASGCRVMSACHCWQLLATTQLSGTHVVCWLLDCRCDDCLSNSSLADFISLTLTFLFTPTDLLVTTPPSGTTVQRIQFQSHWLHVFVDSDPLICWL